MYYPFTEALKTFLERAEWSGQRVPVVFAGPDRAFQELERRMKRVADGRRSKVTSSQGLTKQGATDRKGWVPFMSVLVQPFSYDRTRFNPGSWRQLTKDIPGGNVTQMRFPRPVAADVQVDLWCGSAGGWEIAQHVAAQIEMQFTAESVYLPIDWRNPDYYKPPFNIMEHAKQYGITGMRFMNNGWQDNSGLEVGDGAKEVRWTFNGRIEAYLPYRLNEARIVQTVEIDVIDAATLEVVDTFVGGAED